MKSTERMITVRPETRPRYLRFAAKRRLSISDVTEIAIDALEALSRREVDALIERRPKPRAKKKAPK